MVLLGQSAKIVVSMELTDQVVQNNVNVGMMHTATQKMVGVDATMVLWANYVKRLAPKEDMEKIVSKSVDVLPIILKCVVMWMVHVIVYQVSRAKDATNCASQAFGERIVISTVIVITGHIAIV